MQELDYSIDDLQISNSKIIESLNRIETKLDSLFHGVPVYEEAKQERVQIPRSGNLRRRLEVADLKKHKQIPA